MNCLEKRSIDLIAAHSLISDTKLPGDVTPNSYNIKLHPNPEVGNFSGEIRINTTVQHRTKQISMHKHPDLTITALKVVQVLPSDYESKKYQRKDIFCATIPYFLFKFRQHSESKVEILKSNWEQVPKQSIFTIDLSADVNTGGVLEIYIKFEGLMFNNTSEGLFRSSYVDSQTKQPKWWDCFNCI